MRILRAVLGLNWVSGWFYAHVFLNYFLLSLYRTLKSQPTNKPTGLRLTATLLTSYVRRTIADVDRLKQVQRDKRRCDVIAYSLMSTSIGAASLELQQKAASRKRAALQWSIRDKHPTFGSK